MNQRRTDRRATPPTLPITPAGSGPSAPTPTPGSTAAATLALLVVAAGIAAMAFLGLQAHGLESTPKMHPAP